MRKKEAKPSVLISHWEESWNESDYKEHENQFQDMLIEYRNILVLCNQDAITARMKWLEKNKAVKIKGSDVFVNAEYYSMHSAQFGKFCEWLSRKERMDPAYEVMRKKVFENVSERMKKIGVIPQRVDSELESLDKLSEQINDDTKNEFNNMEV